MEVNKTANDEKRPHTVQWAVADFERVCAAAEALGRQIHADVSLPDFMRGAILRRCDEVLGVSDTQVEGATAS
jgi:hypothetical protein